VPSLGEVYIRSIGTDGSCSDVRSPVSAKVVRLPNQATLDEARKTVVAPTPPPAPSPHPCSFRIQKNLGSRPSEATKRHRPPGLGQGLGACNYGRGRTAQPMVGLAHNGRR